MSESRSWLADPFLLREYATILSARGRQYYRRSLLATVTIGVIEGACLVSILPTVTALATGAKQWGLSASGWLVSLVILAGLGLVLAYGQAILSYLAAVDLIRDVLARVGDQLARLPLGWFGPAVSGKLSALVSSGVMTMGQGMAHQATPILRNGMALLVLLAGVSAWQWYLGAALALAIPLVLGLVAVSAHLRRASEQRVAAAEAELANRLVEFTACQAALRSAGRSTSYTELERARKDAAGVARRDLWNGVVANGLSGVGVQAVVVGLIALAALLGTSGELSPIATVAFIGVTLRFTRMLQGIGDGALGIEHARQPVQSTKAILHASPLPQPATSGALPRPGQVEFRNVSFAYDARPVLREVSFTVAPRTVTAIVGPSGSGKTTLFRLAARFWDASSGAVLIGGRDVREQTTSQLMDQLSMVFQDVYLYDDTLEANIRVGNEAASTQEVREAAELAGVSEIAARLPNGWETRVGERGGKLSGGERQRVSIARALLKRAPIALFDEATSALDPENEANIDRSIQRLRAASTVLIIAHKLDTVRTADQIVVLDAHGTVSQRGTHAELIDRAGLYRTFWQRRQQSAGWQLTPAT